MPQPSVITCNEYPWTTFLRREQRDSAQELDHILNALSVAGFTGYEPMVRNPAHAEKLLARTATYGLSMPSVYVNTTLHDPAQVEHSIAQVSAIAQSLVSAGTRIIVTNPSPIRWDTRQDKDDAQLATQAAALDRLGAALAGIGITLAYHNHDMELRHAAREFHHMLCATDPAHVALCLDAHWIYRGAGNSQVALFDIVQLYGARIVELHLRQSRDGVWSEAFAPGDIDYVRLAAELRARGIMPHIVLEQAVEADSPHTMTAQQAHVRSLAHVRELFG